MAALRDYRIRRKEYAEEHRGGEVSAGEVRGG